MRKLEHRKGSIPPIVTPSHDGAADYDTYTGLVELQPKEGSQGQWVNGTAAGLRGDAVRERACRPASEGQAA